MTMATVVQLRTGLRNHANVYVKIKNNSVYRFKSPLNAHQQESLMGVIKRDRNRIQLKQWVLAKKG